MLGKVLLPAVVIACPEEARELAHQDAAGNVEVVIRVEYLYQVVFDDEAVSLLLCPGVCGDHEAGTIGYLPEPSHCLGCPQVGEGDMPSVRCVLVVGLHLESALPE